MPWKECHVMDERIRFVARLLEGEKMTPLCAEFGISRKTGYNLFNRYKGCGVAAFTDRSRRPYRQANRLPPQLKAVVPLNRVVVTLMRYDLGYGEMRRVGSTRSTFRSIAKKCYRRARNELSPHPCVRKGPWLVGEPPRNRTENPQIKSLLLCQLS